MNITINKAVFAPYSVFNRMSGKTKTPMSIEEKWAISEQVQGYYKKTSNGIQLMDFEGVLFAYITKNDGGFIVTARRYPELGNRIRYQFALCSREEMRFGYQQPGDYSGMSNEDRKHLDNEVKKALNQLGFFN